MIKTKSMKIFGIGMNYAAHNREMQGLSPSPPSASEQQCASPSAPSAPTPGCVSPSAVPPPTSPSRTAQPVVFTKADSALRTRGRPFFIPDFSERCDYETELVVRISRLGRSIPLRFAHRYYDAVTVGIDFTARDLQASLRSQGLPWDLCKGFDGSAAVGQFVPVEALSSTIQDLHFHLDINGHTVQQGHTADMLFTVDELVAFISQYFTLRTGDLIFTGTPAGIGPVHIDDHLDGYLDGRHLLSFNVK